MPGVQFPQRSLRLIPPLGITNIPGARKGHPAAPCDLSLLLPLGQDLRCARLQAAANGISTPRQLQEEGEHCAGLLLRLATWACPAPAPPSAPSPRPPHCAGEACLGMSVMFSNSSSL